MKQEIQINGHKVEHRSEKFKSMTPRSTSGRRTPPPSATRADSFPCWVSEHPRRSRRHGGVTVKLAKETQDAAIRDEEDSADAKEIPIDLFASIGNFCDAHS